MLLSWFTSWFFLQLFVIKEFSHWYRIIGRSSFLSAWNFYSVFLFINLILYIDLRRRAARSSWFELFFRLSPAFAINFVTQRARVAYSKAMALYFASCLKFSRAFKAIDLTPVVSPFAFRHTNMFSRGEPFVSESEDGEFMK